MTTVELTEAGRELAEELTSTIGAGVEALLDRLEPADRRRVVEIARSATA